MSAVVVAGLAVALVYGVFDNVDIRSEHRHDEWSTTFKQLSLDGEHRFTDNFRLTGKIGTLCALAARTTGSTSTPVSRTSTACTRSSAP